MCRSGGRSAMVVNALANFANRMHEPSALEPLATFMGRVIQASASLIKEDLEKNNPGRPWRVLHLNRGIVATRTHNPTIMEQVFGIPGMGNMLINAIFNHDYPIIRTLVYIYSLLYIGGSILTDISYCLADPRVRLEG